MDILGLSRHGLNTAFEQLAVLGVVIVAGLSLVYAWFLRGKVLKKDKGTEKMQEVWEAIRVGADGYLKQQFKTILPAIGILTIAIFLSVAVTEPSREAQMEFGYMGDQAVKWIVAVGRTLAFITGATFSLLVGQLGMRMAIQASVRAASAARRSFNEALSIAYYAGTITGMLTDGLGLMGGTVIFIIFGRAAPDALLGFGFGGTLLAMFMRIGGGIYTKAADVGADLVGKVEQGIPEDDPRNAATIADNVGDNVGDCAGMAADIFESYEVTIVAAMILGMASFGHKGVIFPLLVRGIGVLGSIISTYTVKAGPNDTSDTALKSGHRGFWIGSLISVGGFFALGFSYLRFDAAYLEGNPMAKAGFPNGDPTALGSLLNFGIPGLDLRPAMTCLIGVFLAIALNKVTSYFTHTGHAPVKGLARACQTGHATNIIQGFAVGYESTVMAIIVIAGAIGLSVLCYAGTPPLFIAYGVAMAGIGMLTLTGNTISR